MVGFNKKEAEGLEFSVLKPHERFELATSFSLETTCNIVAGHFTRDVLCRLIPAFNLPLYGINRRIIRNGYFIHLHHA